MNSSEDLRGKEEKKKFDFAKKKENTIHSLKDVDVFLQKATKSFKYLQIFKFFK